MNFTENLKKLRDYFNTSNARLEKILELSNGYISNLEKTDTNGRKSTDNPGKILLSLNKQGISVDWFLTGEGAMFTNGHDQQQLPPPTKPPLIKSLEELIAENMKPLMERLETVERHLWNMNKTLSPVNRKLDYDFETFENPLKIERIPFVEDIAAGPFISQSESADEYIEVPCEYMKASPDEYYAAHIKGRSMTEAGIPDDAIVLIRQNNVPKDSAIQLVWHDGKTTLKRMRQDENGNWKLCYEDGSGKCIEIKPHEAYHIAGDFVVVLPIKNEEL